jgi:hypothetical protein
LPSRLQYPDYYKVILRPIALDTIEDKVVNKEYINPHALITDLRQMVENAQYFNEEGSEVWEAAEEVRRYVESTTVPTLLADGFTLDPNDTRQSAMPIELAANSSIPSQAAAFRIQAERRLALENGTSTEMIESVSPELPHRTLGTPHDKVKSRFQARGEHASASPGPLSDFPPPIHTPSSAGLGLSVNDHNRLGVSPNHYHVASPGSQHPGLNYASPSSVAATPSSYLGNPNQSLSSPANVLPWATTAATNGTSAHFSPSAQGNSSYFAQQYPNGLPQGLARQASSSSLSSMAPPGALGYPNGSMPFQRPTNIQMLPHHQGGNQATLLVPGGATPSSQTSPLLSKRLPGEASQFDPLQTNVLHLSPEVTIVREPVVSHFDIKVHSKESGKEKLSYQIRNDVTRLHSINISSNSSEQLELQVELTPRDLFQKEIGEGKAKEDRRWTLSIHHNGKGVRPHWQGEEMNGVAKKGSEEAAAPAIPSTSTSSSSSSTRVQVPSGNPCRFKFTPQPGANIVNVHVYPPPPNATLQEIVSDERHPLRSKAKALSDLPERYRLLVYCRP